MCVYLIDYENVGMKGLNGIGQLSENDKVYIFYGKNAGSVSFETLEQIINSPAKVNCLRALKSAKNYLDFQLVTFSGFLVAHLDDKEYKIISKDTGFDAVVDFWNARQDSTGGVRFTRQETVINMIDGEKKKEKIVKKVTSDRFKHQQSVKTHHQNSEEQIKKIEKEVEFKPEIVPISKRNENIELHEYEMESEQIKKVSSKSSEKLSDSFRKRIREKVKGENLKAGTYTSIYNCVLKSDSKQQLHTNLVKALKMEKGAAIYKLIVPIFEEYHKTNM